MVYDIYQDWCKRVNSSTGSTVSNEDSTTSSDFQLVDEHILKIFDGSSQEELTAQFIRNQAMKIASHLGLSDFNASSNWLARFLERHNRSLGIVPQRVAPEKDWFFFSSFLFSNRKEPGKQRKPFVRLSFGEKHIISKFIIANPKLPVRAYAEHFSSLFNKTVTQKQIEVTKENLQKWADESYAGSSQSYEKFNRRASTRLSKSEREEIAHFLARHPSVTLEETARSFSKKWAKNVNRTHIARIKQNFKTAEQILHEDMVASITEDYHENSSRPTMVPQFSRENEERKLGVPLTHCPVIKKRKNSLFQADQPSTVIQTISDDSGDEQQRPIFKYGQPYSQMAQPSPPIDQQAAQILRCPQCSIILSSPEEFWGHLRENHYSILYSNACQPLLSPDSKGI